MNRVWVSCLKLAMGIGGLLFAMTAHAHGGHDSASGFASGLVHPFTGFDHVVVILGIGLLAAQMRGGEALALPISFLVTMSLVAAFTVTGAASSWVEYGIFASMLAVGAALALRIRGPLLATVGMVALFAAFHGHLHGAEAVAGARAEFLFGMVVATAALHALGFAIGRVTALEHMCRYGGAVVVAIAVIGSI